MTPPVELLVLDAHGVLFNAPLTGFLDGLAHASGQPAAAVRGLWRAEVRAEAWLGAAPDEAIWRRLAPMAVHPGGWQGRLEPLYALGPAAAALPRWRAAVPVWVLSNHRGAWLRARLDRFGLSAHVDRVLVSDELGVMKPDRAAFATALAAATAPGAVLFVDDQPKNVDAARALGLRAVHATGDAWVASVDAALGLCPAPPRRDEA